MLEEQWLPDIIEKNPVKIIVWSAGCAGGEEVYSFKILWERLSDRAASLPQLEMVATDRNSHNIERARNGVYGPGSLKELSALSRSVFFEISGDARRYAVKTHLKKDIIWNVHHLLTEPPGPNYNIIFLRNNILTYYGKEIQKRVLRGILPCLLSGGLLIIGCHESLPVRIPALNPIFPFSYVFRFQDRVS
jgi:chemotaxis protein methyltransferase CheR